MVENAICGALKALVENVYAAAYRAGLLMIDADETPLSTWLVAVAA